MSANTNSIPANSPARKKRRTSAVTLHDVARLAGVAPITASRAINHPDQVSDALKARVTKAVNETGYIPNLVAGSLASSKSRLVAMLVPTLVGPVFQETVQALSTALHTAGYQLFIGQSGYHDAKEDAFLDTIIRRRPDAIVLTGLLKSASARKRLIASGIPVVETWDLSNHPVDMLVGFSHEAIGQAVAAYFHQQGRRNPVVIGANDARSVRRANAFCKTFSAYSPKPSSSIPRVISVAAPATLGDGRTSLSQLIQENHPVDAVFCSSDLLAHGVMIEAQVRNIAIPDALSVVGFGDVSYAKDVHPSLSTIRIDGANIGKLAAQMIIQRLTHQTITQPISDVGFELIIRQST
jgi:LacI family gluconate utilization system Gnt-I transcriptional repressor